MSKVDKLAQPLTCDAEPRVKVVARAPLVQRSTGLDAVVRRRRAVQAERQATVPKPEIAQEKTEWREVLVQPLNIIVIDDEADQVELTVMLLQLRGHKATGTTDGSRAVELVAAEHASVVLLDFMLGRTTGGDVCQALRAESRTQDVRVVLLSGTPEVEIRRTCTLYDAYLRKPPTSNALFRVIEGMARR